MDSKNHLVQKTEDELQRKKAQELSKFRDDIAFTLFSQAKSLSSFPSSGRIEDVIEQFLKSPKYRETLTSEEQERLLEMLNRTRHQSDTPSFHIAEKFEVEKGDTKNIASSFEVEEQEKCMVDVLQHSSEREILIDMKEALPTSTPPELNLPQAKDAKLSEHHSSQLSENHSSHQSLPRSLLTLADDQQLLDLHSSEGMASEPDLQQDLQGEPLEHTDTEELVGRSTDSEMSREMGDLAIFSKLVEHTTFTKDENF